MKFLSARWNCQVDKTRMPGINTELCLWVKLKSKADSSLLSNCHGVRCSLDRGKNLSHLSRPLHECIINIAKSKYVYIPVCYILVGIVSFLRWIFNTESYEKKIISLKTVCHLENS